MRDSRVPMPAGFQRDGFNRCLGNILIYGNTDRGGSGVSVSLPPDFRMTSAVPEPNSMLGSTPPVVPGGDRTPLRRVPMGKKTGGPSDGVAPSLRDAEAGASLVGKSTHDPIEHRMVHAKLGTVASIFYALHAKHVPTASHSMRVAFCVSTWAITERLREKELEQVEIAALLHDIGKIGVPDRILQKPERLNADEQAVMALHPEIGIDILRSAGASNELLETFRQVGVWYNRFENQDGNQALMI